LCVAPFGEGGLATGFANLMGYHGQQECFTIQRATFAVEPVARNG
jgi:hypothetical protein